MIPFGTLMQACGSMPAMGSGGTGTGNPAAANSGTGTGNQAAADNGPAQPGGDTSDSFSAWVRKLTGKETTMASDGEASEQLRNVITESEATELKAIDWEQLTSMIADAIELSPDLPDDGRSVDGLDFSGLQGVLQQMANGDNLEGGDSSLKALTNLVMGSVNGSHRDLRLGGNPPAGVKKMSIGGQQGQPPGQGANASGAMAEIGAASIPTAATERGVETAGLEGVARGKGAVVSGAMVENNAKPGRAAAAEPGFVTADLAQPQDDGKPAAVNPALRAQQNKEKPGSPVDPTVVQPAETAEEETPEVNAQRLNDDKKKAVRGIDFGPSQKDSPQTQPSLAVSTGKDDGNSTTTDEDSPDHRRVVRSEIQAKNQSADAGEKELPKGTTPSDPVKTANPEQNRFSDAIQDATRTMTEKSGAIQTAPSERTEATAAQRFQTTVMEQIVDKASLRSVQGRSEIQIRLKPDFLGNVQMNVAADKEQVVVRMVTDHPVVKEVVEANLHHLKTELQHQGLTIDRFEVTVNPDAGQQQNREQFAQMFKNPSFQNGRRQGSEQEPGPNHRENGHREDDHPADAKADGINYFA